MKAKHYNAILITFALGLFLTALLVSGFQPTPVTAPPQDPCATEVGIAKLETQAKALRLAEAEKEITLLRAEANEAENKLAAEQSNSATLASKNAAQSKTIATITTERDRALLKIKRANGRWYCDELKLFCVK